MADATYDVVTALVGISSSGPIESGGDITSSRNINCGGRFTGDGALPTGIVLPHAGSIVPPGFLECDGSSVTIDSYPNLYSVLGVTFGYAGTLTERTVSTVTASSSQDLTGVKDLIPFGTGSDDQVPVLTADSASAIASRNDTGYEKWRAFDGNTTSKWKGLTSDASCYLGYNFGTGKIITGYSLRCLAIVEGKLMPEYNPKTWTFEGSNNGSDWTVLHSIEDFDFSMDMPYDDIYRKRVTYTIDKKALRKCHRHKWIHGGYVYSKWLVESTTSYQYYRVNISAASSGSTVYISDFAIMSGDVIYSSAGSIKDDTRTSVWSSEVNPETPPYVVLDCGSDVVVNSYKMCGQYTMDTIDFAPTRWVIEGSTDGSTYTVLHGVNAETFSTHDRDWFFLFENTTAYRYYRFTFTPEGSDDERVLIHGIELFSSAITGFCVPDLQDYFVRGWDHSRSFGGTQDDAFQGHFHTSKTQVGGFSSTGPSGEGCISNTNTLKKAGTGAPTYYWVDAPVTDGTNGTPRTDDETRPKNIALMYIIKT